MQRIWAHKISFFGLNPELGSVQLSLICLSSDEKDLGTISIGRDGSGSAARLISGPVGEGLWLGHFGLMLP